MKLNLYEIGFTYAVAESVSDAIRLYSEQEGEHGEYVMRRQAKLIQLTSLSKVIGVPATTAGNLYLIEKRYVVGINIHEAIENWRKQIIADHNDYQLTRQISYLWDKDSQREPASVKFLNRIEKVVGREWLVSKNTIL